MELDEAIAVRSTKTVYRSGDKTIKLFNEGYSKSDILNEALNLARIEETDLNVPHLLEVTKIDNRWGIVIEYIEGKSLEQLMNEYPDQKQEFMNKFVDVQLDVLSREAPPLLNRMKEKMKRKISNIDLKDSVKYEIDTRLDSAPKHNRICHGDFNPSNVIIKNDGSAYIIDWAHVTSGNRSADCAQTYLLFLLAGRRDDAENYLNLFEAKSGIPKVNVQRWIPVVAATQLSKASEEEKKILMQWIDVMDY